MFIVSYIFAKAGLSGVPDVFWKYFILLYYNNTIRWEGVVKKNNIEVRTKYCAFLHSFLGMRGLTVTFEPL